MNIAVFDSGVGGLSVANAIRQALPQLDVHLYEDRQHLPYGTKTPDELYALVEPIFQTIIAEGNQLIVIACNTVSTTVADRLCQRFPDTTLIRIEPMVQQAAAQTKSKIIAVCATPTTLASARYQLLKATFAKDCSVLEPDCSQWASMIEHSQLDMDHIAETVTQLLARGADVIVLGCTHYHWIELEIKSLIKIKAIVLQPEPQLIRRLAAML